TAGVVGRRAEGLRRRRAQHASQGGEAPPRGNRRPRAEARTRRPSRCRVRRPAVAAGPRQGGPRTAFAVDHGGTGRAWSWRLPGARGRCRARVRVRILAYRRAPTPTTATSPHSPVPGGVGHRRTALARAIARRAARTRPGRGRGDRKSVVEG